MDINIDEDSVWTYKNIQMEKLELCEKNVEKEEEWVKGELWMVKVWSKWIGAVHQIHSWVS